ncbi:uncharacterized protein BDZ99DRAFT_454723 [Mytilinidion resinicola]|uniref:Transferase family protein n=1 Tax=Mytilinidion resinicola TaxID=574789 RepID=A0A6A6Y0P6_9PEZI|nr:uncharacterized protein BDZ99DRAFT_454723 [Mytilinidion resinicola]KAF2802386.1 hypothetical protein BDZ99DRAFT_454723 [Mytilinidion resinicola]
MPAKTLNLKTISQARLQPSQPSSQSSTQPLSTIDSSVLHFAPTGAIWIYDPPTQTPYSPSHLLDSLRKTLSYYPQWCGQLSWTPFNPSLGHANRCQRVQLTWGSANDPGVEVIVAHSPLKISEILLNAEERAKKSWEPASFPSHELFPDIKLAFADAATYEGLPGMIVQLTAFECGALAVAVKMAHVLGDAQTLITFMKDWANIYRDPLFTPEPLFSPSTLSHRASGNIDAPTPDPSLLSLANTVSRTRYDYYAPTPSAPSWAASAMSPPPDLSSTPLAPPGRPPPWELWNQRAASKKVILHFTVPEILAIHAAVTPTRETKVSQHTALVSHVWLSLLHARAATSPPPATASGAAVQGRERKADVAHLTLSLSLRTRVAPPLPAQFLGSPIVHAAAAVPLPGTSGAPALSLSETATEVTAALASFDKERVGALLHEAAFVDAPGRYWDAFLGERNGIVTSWVRAGVWEVRFGEGGARYVEPVMPELDGVVVVVEAGGNENGGHWTENGVDVMVSARAEVVDELVRDGYVRKFR